MLTVAQVAERLGVSVRRVQQLIASGALAAERYGNQYLVADDFADPRRPRGRPKKAN